jgi:hypothetical protein
MNGLQVVTARWRSKIPGESVENKTKIKTINEPNIDFSKKKGNIKYKARNDRNTPKLYFWVGSKWEKSTKLLGRGKITAALHFSRRLTGCNECELLYYITPRGFYGDDWAI